MAGGILVLLWEICTLNTFKRSGRGSQCELCAGSWQAATSGQIAADVPPPAWVPQTVLSRFNLAEKGVTRAPKTSPGIIPTPIDHVQFGVFDEWVDSIRTDHGPIANEVNLSVPLSIRVFWVFCVFCGSIFPCLLRHNFAIR